jgi:drug/metabolite transporter (DMT)-like permease
VINIPEPVDRRHVMFWRFAPVIFLLLWSSGFSFVKLGLPYAEPLTFLALRYAIAVLLLIPLYAWLRPPLPRGRKQWVPLIVTGLLIQSLYFGLMYMSLKLGASAGAIALIMSLQPILVAVVAPLLLNEKVGEMRWLGLAIGLIGAAIVIVAKSRIESTSMVALSFAFGALAGITAGTLYEKRFGQEIHPITANFIQYVVGFISIFPLALMLEKSKIEWSANLLISLSYLVIANSLIAISLLLGMLRRGEASKVASLFFMIPPLAAFVAWMMLGETMPILAWLGLAFAGIGVLIVQKSGIKK